MCNFASFVLTKDKAFWSEKSDSHEQIITEHGLEHLDRSPIGLVRVEITPNQDSISDLDSWGFHLDQDALPDWTFAGDSDIEKRARKALAQRAKKEMWFAEVIDQQATAGYAGTATAGDAGTATAGDAGTATAGDDGTATAGYRGTATAGDAGIVAIRWWDNESNRYRLVVGYPGENGIKANTPYRVVDGKLVEVR